jgi:hypothetical protein
VVSWRYPHYCLAAWSPNGSPIAFLRNSGSTDELTVAADGSEEQETQGVFVSDCETIA